MLIQNFHLSNRIDNFIKNYEVFGFAPELSQLHAYYVSGMQQGQRVGRCTIFIEPCFQWGYKRIKVRNCHSSVPILQTNWCRRICPVLLPLQYPWWINWKTCAIPRNIAQAFQSIIFDLAVTLHRCFYGLKMSFCAIRVIENKILHQCQHLGGGKGPPCPLWLRLCQNVTVSLQITLLLLSRQLAML